MIQVPFGFFPYEEGYEFDGFRIIISDAFDEAIDAVDLSGRVNDGWFYPPLEKQVPKEPRVRFGIQVNEKNAVEVEVAWYGLPSTHTLIHNKSSSLERAHFLIIAFGFTLGMRLFPDGFGHLTRTPVRRSVFGDLRAYETETTEVMNLFDRFYLANSQYVSRSLLAIINALQWGLSQPYNHVRFMHLYMALDGCGGLFDQLYGARWRSPRIHAALARDLCVKAKIPVPKRAKTYRLRRPNGSLACTYSQIRNALIHEALSEGMPAGFAGDMPMHESSLDLEGLVYRLVYHIIGYRADSIRSSIDSRMTGAL